MFTQKREYHRRGSGPLVIFRVMLSLMMFLILSLACYSAFRYFTGVDPLKFNPQGLLLSLSSERGSSIISDLSRGNITKLNADLQSLLAAGKSSSPAVEGLTQVNNNQSVPISSDNSDKQLLLRFAVMGDSHNDNEDLAKAIKQAEKSGAKFIIGVGDYTDTGTPEELAAAQQTWQTATVKYYLTAGDHDLWAARDQKQPAITYYQQVFGTPYESFGDSNIRFILVNNADNYEGIDKLQMHWLDSELSRLATNPPLQTFVFLHEPLYHPTSDHVMGWVTASLTDQANQVSQSLASSGVGGVFAGHTHFFSQYVDPQTSLNEVAVGAVTRQQNTQNPRFVMVDVYLDGSYNVEDTEIK
ncbi:MAG: metallophosphoesterase [Patescibacteria group bacterium]|nr:metallophosphoesterase [Patescibacteria group bacterium]